MDRRLEDVRGPGAWLLRAEPIGGETVPSDRFVLLWGGRLEGVSGKALCVEAPRLVGWGPAQGHLNLPGSGSFCSFVLARGSEAVDNAGGAIRSDPRASGAGGLRTPEATGA